MFLVRRVCKVERKDVWQVAKLLRSICNAYESENGRNSAMVYISGAVSYTHLTLPTKA